MLSFPPVASKPVVRVLHRAALSCLLGLCLAGATAACWTTLARADAELCLDAHERAQVDRLEGRYLAARDRLLVCAQRECPRLVSTDCTTWLAQLDATLPTVVFAVSDNTGRDLLEARVIVNGRLIANHVDGHALPLDPGVYTVRFEADGYAPDEQTLSVRDGEKSRLARGTLTPLKGALPAGAATSPHPASSDSTVAGGEGDASLARENGRVEARGVSARERRMDPRARQLRIATYTLAAAAVASFSVALASSLRGYHLEKACRDGCPDTDIERGKQLYRTVDVSLAVGGALLAAGSLTLFRARRRAASRDSARLGFGAYADSGGASVTAWSRW